MWPYKPMIIDLSVALHNDTPIYPGDPQISISQDTAVAADGYMGHSLKLGTHNGTHIDAPAHMLEGGKTLGNLPLSTFVSPGKLVAGFSIAALEATGVDAGDIVIFDTGTAQRFSEPSYFENYPVMSLEVADWLIQHQVKLVGLDTCSADNTDGFPVHKKLLGAGIPIIETLTNVTSLQGLNFTIYALPLKLDLDGAPARVIAITEDQKDY